MNRFYSLNLRIPASNCFFLFSHYIADIVQNAMLNLEKQQCHLQASSVPALSEFYHDQTVHIVFWFVTGFDTVLDYVEIWSLIIPDYF